MLLDWVNILLNVSRTRVTYWNISKHVKLLTIQFESRKISILLGTIEINKMVGFSKPHMLYWKLK